jgi:hypothetical protein
VIRKVIVGVFFVLLLFLALSYLGAYFVNKYDVPKPENFVYLSMNVNSEIASRERAKLSEAGIDVKLQEHKEGNDVLVRARDIKKAEEVLRSIGLKPFN